MGPKSARSSIPENQLVGILLTQVGMSTPDSARVIHDFWTTLYQAIDD
ncbi:hypothetical protein [Sinosporangium siamense]|uniref:Uncharacterized protein n=1 Tax=Sinosporangium siamense TaxID=1367973 RepID=A0A919V6L2_9ACTN|nr:hypothetical protein [Sinosporangium siamense]GII94185.1 hypothetical protein Ssi02_44160 [Sinosporangium siamense]